MVCGRGSTSFFYLYIFSGLAPFAGDTILFPIEVSRHLCSKSIEQCKSLFLGSQFNSIDLYAFLMPIPHCVDYCSFVISFEIRTFESSKFVLFQDQLLGSLRFPYEFLRSVCKFLQQTKSQWDFVRDCIDSVDQFWEYCHPNSIKFFNP